MRSASLSRCSFLDLKSERGITHMRANFRKKRMHACLENLHAETSGMAAKKVFRPLQILKMLNCGRHIFWLLPIKESSSCALDDCLDSPAGTVSDRGAPCCGDL